jgi:tetratricopeptide (TPR) repeat protein
MKRKADLPDPFSETVKEAAKILSMGSLYEALPVIKEALILSTEAAEPHNLLGIFFEMKGDDNNARKHYRAAYALDPTYKPACRNLERLVDFVWGPVSRKYDYGVALQEEREAKQPQKAVSDLGRQGLGTV